MKRRLAILAIVVTSAATAIALLIGVVGMAEEETSRMRLVHSIPQAPAVRVLVDGKTAYPNVSYTTVTTYTTLPAGPHTVEVRTVLLDLFLVSETLPLRGGVDLTIMGIVTGSMPTVTLLIDNNTVLNRDTVRLVHLSHGTPAMDVILTGTVGTAKISALPYPEASAYVAGLGAGEVALEVRAEGEVKKLDPPTVTLQSNAIHTLFIMGEGNTLDLVAVVDQEFDEVHKVLLPLVIKAGTGD